MGIEDEYAAFCLDETCLFMIQQAREKREPDFGRPARLEKQKGRQNATTNAEAAEMIRPRVFRLFFRGIKGPPSKK